MTIGYSAIVDAVISSKWELQILFRNQVKILHLEDIFVLTLKSNKQHPSIPLVTINDHNLQKKLAN